MIYLENITGAQMVYLPASGPKVDGEIVLEMVSNIDRTSLDGISAARVVAFVDADGKFFHDDDGFQFVVPGNDDGSRLYYSVAVELPEGITEGEYEYKASIGDRVVSCGLAIVGDRTAPVEENNNTVEYEQYNAFN